MANDLERIQETGLTRATMNKHELATEAAAAHATALVQARFTMAVRRPRSVMDVRGAILRACERPRFCETAEYELEWVKNQKTGENVRGFSIRFAEECLRSYGNVDVRTSVVFDDPEKRIFEITVMDLESNHAFTEQITVTKTVERSSLKGDRKKIGERTNSNGKTVYIVEANDQDLSAKEHAHISKVVRTLSLKLIPADILEEARDRVRETLKRTDAQDPMAAIKKIMDAFAVLNVPPRELEEFLGVSLTQASPADVAKLRRIYAAIKDEETTWRENLEHARNERVASRQQEIAAEVQLQVERLMKDQTKPEIKADVAAKVQAEARQESKATVTVEEKVAPKEESSPPAKEPARLTPEEVAAQCAQIIKAVDDKKLTEKQVNTTLIAAGVKTIEELSPAKLQELIKKIK